MGQVNLTVGGRVHRIACEDGQEEHVEALGVRFEGAINELRGALGEIGDQRLMVMAGILMTDRLDEVERRLRQGEQEIRDLKESRLDSASRMESLGDSFAGVIEDAAARIERMADRVRGLGEPDEAEA